jgi:hypothetical protein
MLGYAQVQDALRPDFAARVEVVVQRADNGEIIPARVYLFKGGQPFRLSPVDAHLPLRVDLFYRERIWRGAAQPKTLEVTAKDASHFILLEGKASFDLPRSRTDLDEKYRLEAYHGTFYKPAVAEFVLAAGENRRARVTECFLWPHLASWSRADRPAFEHWHRIRQLARGLSVPHDHFQ